MDENLISQIIEFIRTTGETLVTETFRITIMAVYADAVGKFLVFLLMLVLCFGFVKVANGLWKTFDLGSDAAKKDTENGSAYFIWFLLQWFMPTACFLVAFSNLIMGVAYLIAPEWYAVIKLVELVK